MPLMTWDPSLELGDAVIDQQHKGLVDLINQVHEISQSPDRDAEIMHSITAMYLYAKEHFFVEEGLMDRLGYPDREEHILQHKVFVEKAQEITDSHLEGRLDYDGFLKFLVHWLRHHIAMDDARIVQYAANRGA